MSHPALTLQSMLTAMTVVDELRGSHEARVLATLVGSSVCADNLALGLALCGGSNVCVGVPAQGRHRYVRLEVNANRVGYGFVLLVALVEGGDDILTVTLRPPTATAGAVFTEVERPRTPSPTESQHVSAGAEAVRKRIDGGPLEDNKLIEAGFDRKVIPDGDQRGTELCHWIIHRIAQNLRSEPRATRFAIHPFDMHFRFYISTRLRCCPCKHSNHHFMISPAKKK
jgi:hypothetical protein